MSKKLYKFEWDLYYGICEGLFVADETIIAAAMGKNVWLGSIEGKHSEVYGTLESKDLTVVTEDPAFIAEFERLLPTGVGINPLDYIEEGLKR